MSNRIPDEEKYRLEKVFMKFLVKKINNVGGKIQLQHLTGHLSQLNPEVRDSLGSSKVDILKFLKKHTDVFYVDDDLVSLTISDTVNDRDYDSDNSGIDFVSLPKKIQEGTGVIVKLLSGFGFIKSKEPIKTSVYFAAKHFGYDHDTDLTECGLNIGTMVYFDAVKESKDKFSSKYRALKVRKIDKFDENSIISKTRKNRETGLYDPVNLDGEGRIQTVFPVYGFITSIGDEKNTIFFHKNRVANYDNIVDLTQIFNIGDFVEFSAHRSTKSDVKVRWEAAKVWKKSRSCSSIKKQSKDTTCKSDTSNKSIKSLSQFDSKIKCFPETVNKASTTKEMIHNKPGKICPRSNGAVIKFGENFSELADGDSCVYYVCGTQVVDIGWEFTEGDDVKFDAVKIKSAPGWKAVLVWVGDKPDIVLPTCLGDFSEFTDEEVDEIPEDFSSVSSNYLSISSHSSLKSVSMKSESSGFKSNMSCKNSPKLTDSPRVVVKFPRNDGFKSSDLHTSSSYHNSQSSSSSSKVSDKYESSSFKSNSSCKNSSKIADSLPIAVVKFPKNDEFKSSGLHTLPSYDSKSSSPSSKTTDASSEESKSESYRRNKFKKIKSHSVLNSRNNSQPAVKKEIISQSKDTVIQSDECSNYSYEMKDEKSIPTINQRFNEFSEELERNDSIKMEETSECMDIEEKTASIKKLHDIVGKVIKIYSMIAEVKSSELSDNIAFFCSSFYCDNESMADLELNDLRKVLKVGDIVHFNYFEIVDDFGESWKQVSLAWTGQKPKVPELTPSDFIKQNHLSVTIKEGLGNIQPQETTRKFLTSFDDSSPDKSDECASHTESCSDGVEDDKTLFSPLNSERSQVPEVALATPFKELSVMISQKILMNKDLFMDAKVDLNSLSSEIVKLVLERYNVTDSCDNLVGNSSLAKENPENEISNVTCSACGMKITEESSQNVKTKSTEVQTIFTGEVMAQHIYTQC